MQIDQRDQRLYAAWRERNGAAAGEFESFLAREKLDGIVPTYQLLRTASMWKACEAQPFEVPAAQHWPDVKQVLLLLQALRTRNILGEFEVVSGHRGEALNKCAGGVAASAHLRFAIDIVGRPGTVDEQALCDFWKTQGSRWSMGLSKYPSGRIHIDTTGYRTWGADLTWTSSFCAGALASPARRASGAA